MTQALTPEARRNVTMFSLGIQEAGRPTLVFDQQDSTLLVGIQGLPVFRSGEFRDSMGFQHTWEDLHMRQMVTNFEFLRDRNIFPDVPVRAGHPNMLGADPVMFIGGYVTDLRVQELASPHDGKSYSYLLADLDIKDPDFARKITSGLWRNRSSEIGPYVTNSEMELWPVFKGFAYVDIPAVEGLNFSRKPGESAVIFDGTSPIKEFNMDPDEVQNTNTAAPTPPPVPAAPVAQVAQPAQATQFQASQTPVAPVLAPAQQAPAFTFSIGGQATSDFAAVQAHIDSLEAAARETRDVNRRAFVSGLLRDNRIFANQAASMETLALSLDDAQYANFVASYQDAPANQALGAQFTGQNLNQAAPAQQFSQAAAPLATDLIQAKEIIMRHQISGMASDMIKQTSSYKLLEANNQAPVV